MRPRSPSRSIYLFLVAMIAADSVLATCGGGGGGGMGGIAPPSPAPVQTYYVPWKIMKAGVEIPPESQFVVYWFPASISEAQVSELTNSRALTMRSAQCVTMALVPAERTDLQATFEVAGKLPAAVIAKADGSVRVRVENGKGTLKLRDVEKALDKAIDDEEKSLDAALKNADAFARNGDHDAAVAAYREIMSLKCLHQKKAKAAAKGLEKLGEKVSYLDTPSPLFDPALSDRIVRIMNEGLVAEEAGDYETAKTNYERAMELDPADPVPIRYLGELERHHRGRWERATSLFQSILAMNADPLSRAVALHGLGKMTIHAGDSPGGFALFERSIAEYPLALTYRNMAVFWNSEGEREKAAGYTRKALELDPLDPYNVVFAAVYLAEEGKVEKSLMGRPVFTDDPGPVQGKDHRYVGQTNVVEHLIKGPLHKSGIDGHNRFQPLQGHPGGESYGMLFGYPDIKKPLGKPLGKEIQTGSFRHGGRNGHDPQILFRQVNDGLPEDLGIGGDSGSFLWTFTFGFQVKRSHAVEKGGIFFGRPVTFSLGGQHMDQHRGPDMTDVLKSGDQIFQPVAFHRPHIIEMQSGEKHSRREKTRKRILTFLGPLKQILADAGNGFKKGLHLSFKLDESPSG